MAFAALGLAGVVGLAFAGSASRAAGTPAAVPTRAYVVDCFANLVSIDLRSAKVLDRRSLEHLLPAVPSQPVACILNSPRWEDGQLAFDMAAGDPLGDDDLHHRDVRIDLSTDRVTNLSKEHPLAERAFADPVLNAIAASTSAAGQALAPFSASDGRGGRTVAADEAARAGRFVLMRMVQQRPGATAFAVVDLQSRSARVVTDAPAAYLAQMHLSQTGRSVLVEASATPPVAGERAQKRTGHVVQIDVDTGRVTHQQDLPILADHGDDPRVVCFSDDGEIVIGARDTHRLWLVQSDKTTPLDVSNDATTDCFFSAHGG